MTFELLINGSGLAVLALNVSGLVHTSDRSLRTKTGLASALWAANNFLMGAYSAAALSALTVGRQASASAVQERSRTIRRWTCALFMVLTLATGLLTWQGYATLPSIAGSMLATYAMFNLFGARLRWSMVGVSTLWMYNAWAYHSWWQAVANLLISFAAIYGAGRARLSDDEPSLSPNTNS